MTLVEINTLIGLHFLADWVFQPRRVAEKKSKSNICLILHMMVIYFVFIPYVYLFDKDPSLALINAILHGIIDKFSWTGYIWARWAVNKAITGEQFKYWEDYWFYFTIAVDQYIHLLILFLIFY